MANQIEEEKSDSFKLLLPSADNIEISSSNSSDSRQTKVPEIVHEMMDDKSPDGIRRGNNASPTSDTESMQSNESMSSNLSGGRRAHRINNLMVQQNEVLFQRDDHFLTNLSSLNLKAGEVKATIKAVNNAVQGFDALNQNLSQWEAIAKVNEEMTEQYVHCASCGNTRYTYEQLQKTKKLYRMRFQRIQDTMHLKYEKKS